MSDYTKTEGQLLVTPQQLDAMKEDITKDIKTEIQHTELQKRKDAFKFRYPRLVNAQNDPDRKYLSDVAFSTLRRMAQTYPIARACINLRKTQITGLDWDITTIDEDVDEVGYQDQIKFVKDWLKTPTGHRSRMRKFLTNIVDDILTIDAVCYELPRLRNGEFNLNDRLIPVDPSTIVLRVTDTGQIPEPPQPAYKQIIEGKVVAEFTTEEMIYDMLNTSTYSPYGNAPLESLIIVVESALRGALANLGLMKYGNVPEGFLMLPESVAGSKEQVEEWQQWFNAIMQGDPRMISGLKILPEGAEYVPAKKPEDMSFERFEMWLLQQTCAVFDVQPQDIGITYQVNKATGETQQDIGKQRGLIPLSNFIKELMDDLIQEIMGFDNLQFVWANINPTDRQEEIEIAEREINMGALSVDEYRQEQGREPIGLAHYVKTSSGPIMVESIVSGEAFEQPEEKPKEEEEDEETKKISKELDDIKKWRNCVYNDLKFGRPLRKDFQSDNIEEDTYKKIQQGLDAVHSRSQAKLLFDEFIDPDIRASMEMLKIARKMRGLENAEITNN